ncbi:hypothetical protein TrVFT333_001060 [Trichoderma virens FT-333]|nr:hypothetical protein TrVFT333_001060 [Trichoderma virens FT-333]
MFATRALRQAAVHAERTPLIRFLGPRVTPASIDHTPQPHPASPSGKLPEGFTAYYGSGDAAARHNSFGAYRDHAQQHGPSRGPSALKPALVAPLATSSALSTLPRVLPLMSPSSLPASTASPSTCPRSKLSSLVAQLLLNE